MMHLPEKRGRIKNKRGSVLSEKRMNKLKAAVPFIAVLDMYFFKVSFT